MTRSTRFTALAALVVALAACQPETAGGPQSPEFPLPGEPVGMTPAADLPVGSLVACGSTMNPAPGVVWRVISTPSTATVQNGYWGFTVSAAVIRDNPTIAGFQSYCEDRTARTDWWANYTCIYVAPDYPRQQAIAQPYGCAGTTQRLILSARACQSCTPYPPRDTTFMTITP